MNTSWSYLYNTNLSQHMIEEKITAAKLLWHSNINKTSIDFYQELALVLAQWYHMVPQLPIKSLYVYRIHMVAIQSILMLSDTSQTFLKQPETFDYLLEKF